MLATVKGVDMNGASVPTERLEVPVGTLLETSDLLGDTVLDFRESECVGIASLMTPGDGLTGRII